MTTLNLLKRILRKDFSAKQFSMFFTENRCCSTVAQQQEQQQEEKAPEEPEKPLELSAAEVEESTWTTFYKKDDYRHLIEENKIHKKQLRATIFALNRELNRGRKPYPKHLTPEQLVELIQLPSMRKKDRFLRYCSHKEDKEYRHQNPKTRPVYDKPILKVWTCTDEVPKYSLHRNGIFIRIQKNTMSKTLETLMVPHLPFAQKVALDFSFDHLMTPREMNKLSVDMKNVCRANRWSTTPLNLHFCSFDPEKNLSARLVWGLTKARKFDSPYEFTQKPITDLFPKECIVYLSPEGDEVLDRIDHDAVYVIGALVDKVQQPGASSRRAKELGVSNSRSTSLRLSENASLSSVSALEK